MTQRISDLARPLVQHTLAWYRENAAREAALRNRPPWHWANNLPPMSAAPPEPTPEPVTAAQRIWPNLK
jgi:hypothetical protein